MISKLVFERMAGKKRLYKEDFDRKKLQSVQVGSFYVEHTIYNVLSEISGRDNFVVKTSQNKKYDYGGNVIRETATSAATFSIKKKATKTELFELFSRLSCNDIWSAVYYIQDKDVSWQEKLIQKIKSFSEEDALKYIKKDFPTIGKTRREMIGQKVLLTSDNNYYTVRDLSVHFEELETNKPEIAAKKSIRMLDVNTLQSLIFNDVKYILK